MSTQFSEANVTRNAGGEFTGHVAKEPQVRLGGLTSGATKVTPAPFVVETPYFKWPERTDAEFQAAQKRVRDRGQGKAAASLLEAYPDVVAARFVNIGNKDLTAPNGMTMPNPDYVDQRNEPVYAFRAFELRDVLLADGTIASEDNPPRFTTQPGVRKLADNFQDHADLVFDPEDDYETHVDEFYKDHFDNQHVYFHQLVSDATPRPVDVDRWGAYIDTDTRQEAEWVTPEEIAAMGGKTRATALQAHADELIAKHGKEGALELLHQDRLKHPTSGRTNALRPVIKASKDRSWNPFRRRR